MNAKEIIQSAIKSAKEQIKSISAELEAPVLDGTPWMIVMLDDRGDSVLGEWPSLTDGVTTKGFLPIVAVPSHVCGAYLLGEDRANDWIANGRPWGQFRKMHVRDFKEARVGELHGLIETLEKL